ncbi:putative rlpA-like protein, double-psi beta-barrel [Helianthus annuus]|nr:putative rlpA-like protein, double-psi beta-barrel [Helianthus annuus]
MARWSCLWEKLPSDLHRCNQPRCTTSLYGNPTVTVMITDFCPPPGCKGDLDLSHEAFSTIADPRAGGIKISYQQYVNNYLFYIFVFFNNIFSLFHNNMFILFVH